jgi:hypothetical protein
LVAAFEWEMWDPGSGFSFFLCFSFDCCWS